MPKKTIQLLLGLFLILFPAFLKGQTTFQWNSDFERQILSNPDSVAPNDLAWLLLIGKDVSENDVEKVKLAIDELANALKPRLEKLKTWEKQREFIQSSLKENYFKYQRRNASFQELLEKGYYNCLTGTAFYYLTLQELGIESEMVCLPEHVFLKLNVGGEAEYWEAAKIADGLFEPNEFSKNGITTFLVKEEFVPKNWKIPSGFLVSNVDAEKSLTLRQLVALQYKLLGIVSIENNDQLGAFWQFRKSFLLDPLPSTRNISAVIGLGAVSHLPRASFLNLDILQYVYANTEVGLDSARTSHAIKSEVDTLLGTTSKAENLLTLRSRFQAFSEDNPLRLWPDVRMLERRIHFECDTPTVECYEMAKQLYQLDPENGTAAQALILFFSQTLYDIQDPEVLVDSLETFRNRYPIYRNNPKTYRAVLKAMLIGATNRYYNNDLAAGDRLVARFESSYATQSTDSLDEDVGYAYSEGMKAYFRKADYKNARKLLEKGLRFAPSSSMLLETRQKFGHELGMKW